MKKYHILAYIVLIFCLSACSFSNNHIDNNREYEKNEFSIITLTSDDTSQKTQTWKLNFDTMSILSENNDRPIIYTNSNVRSTVRKDENTVYFSETQYISMRKGKYEFINDNSKIILNNSNENEYITSFYYDPNSKNLKTFWWCNETGGINLKYIIFDTEGNIIEESSVKYKGENIFYPSLPPVTERIISTAKGSFFLAENKVLYFDYNNKVTTDFITLDNIKAVIKSYSPSDNYFNKLVDFGVENEILTVSFNADNEIAGTYIAAFDFNKHFIGYSKINKNKISLFRDDRKIEISAEISPAASNICLLRDIR